MDRPTPSTNPLLEYRATLMLYVQRRFKMSRREARAFLTSWLEELDPTVANRPEDIRESLAR